MKLDREPVDVLQDEVDVLPGFCACEDPGSRVLDTLESVLGFIGQSEQDFVTVIQVRCDECMDEDL